MGMLMVIAPSSSPFTRDFASTASGTLKKDICSHSGSYIITPQACRNPFGLVKLLQTASKT